MRAAVAVALVYFLTGCQRGESDAAAPPGPAPRRRPAPSPAPSEPEPEPTPAPVAIPYDQPYTRDVDRICRVEELSQVGAQEGASPQLVTAQWLGSNLETDQARDFLIGLNKIPDSARAATLDAEAAKVGLTTGCPTARRWDGVR